VLLGVLATVGVLVGTAVGALMGETGLLPGHPMMTTDRTAISSEKTALTLNLGLMKTSRRLILMCLNILAFSQTLKRKKQGLSVF